jgi:hypothetical protein
MNWDRQANESLRKSPQEQFKKTNKKQGAESCGTKAQQASGRPKILSLEVMIIPTCHSPCPTTNISPSVRKKAEKKMAHLNLSPAMFFRQ